MRSEGRRLAAEAALTFRNHGSSTAQIWVVHHPGTSSRSPPTAENEGYSPAVACGTGLALRGLMQFKDNGMWVAASAFAVTLVALVPIDAAALGYVNYPPAACRTNGWSLEGNFRFRKAHEFLFDGSGTLRSPNGHSPITCPLYDDDEHPRSSLVSVNVYVEEWDPQRNVQIRACVAYDDDHGGLGGICGNTVGTTAAFTGATRLSVPLSEVLASSAGAPYLAVTLVAENIDGKMAGLVGYTAKYSEP
jgi:hypothetical protein